MVTYHEALEKISKIAKMNQIEYGKNTETIDLLKASGRIIINAISSAEDVPNFNNSAMDGFALVANNTLSATKDHPLTFEVIGEIAAGDWLTEKDFTRFSPHSCFEIMTGAPMPESFIDSVVRVEEVVRLQNSEGRSVIQITKAVSPGDHVRRRGSDIGKGQEIFPSKTKISSEMILTAAACGVSQVEVYKKPKVMVVSTGSELVDFHSSHLKPGKIRNSTGPYLNQKLIDMGCDVTKQLFITDKPDLFFNQMEEALLTDVDIILTTGAVSMGKYDFIISVLNDLGAKIHFHKVAIRPGKPVVFAEIPVPGGNKTITFFGMPGNPVSTAVALRFFVKSYLLELQGLASENFIKGRMLNSIKKPSGLKCFYKAKLQVTEGIINLEVPSSQASYLVKNFTEVDHWVLLSEEGTQVNSGEIVEFCQF